MLRRFFSCSTRNKNKDSSNEIEAPVSMEKRTISTVSSIGNNPSQYNTIGPYELYGDMKAGHGVGKFECQDSYIIIPNLSPNSCFIGVFDGHGPHGKNASLFVKESFSKALATNHKKLARLGNKSSVDSFYKTLYRNIDNQLNDSKIDTRDSGTCCVTAFFHNRTCYVANVGDSKAIIAREQAPGSYVPIPLTVDHKPTLESERVRILQNHGLIEPIYVAGKEVGPLRVWTSKRDAGLAMTRAMGDLTGKKAGLISEPDIIHYEFAREDRFMVMASDGLWDVMTIEEVVTYASNYIGRGKLRSKVARALVKEASRRWAKMYEDEYFNYQDDISVVVAFPMYGEEARQAQI